METTKTIITKNNEKTKTLTLKKKLSWGELSTYSQLSHLKIIKKPANNSELFFPPKQKNE